MWKKIENELPRVGKNILFALGEDWVEQGFLGSSGNWYNSKGVKVGDIIAWMDMPVYIDTEKKEKFKNVLRKDKYLRLAYYLEKNRGDWSNGYDYAEEGLKGFRIESDIDISIADEIDILMSDDDVDGRVFRDCKYNYNFLKTLVNRDVLAEYNNLGGADND